MSHFLGRNSCPVIRLLCKKCLQNTYHQQTSRKPLVYCHDSAQREFHQLRGNYCVHLESSFCLEGDGTLAHNWPSISCPKCQGPALLIVVAYLTFLENGEQLLPDRSHSCPEMLFIVLFPYKLVSHACHLNCRSRSIYGRTENHEGRDYHRTKSHRENAWFCTRNDLVIVSTDTNSERTCIAWKGPSWRTIRW